MNIDSIWEILNSQFISTSMGVIFGGLVTIFVNYHFEKKRLKINFNLDFFTKKSNEIKSLMFMLQDIRNNLAQLEKLELDGRKESSVFEEFINQSSKFNKDITNLSLDIVTYSFIYNKITEIQNLKNNLIKISMNAEGDFDDDNISIMENNINKLQKTLSDLDDELTKKFIKIAR